MNNPLRRWALLAMMGVAQWAHALSVPGPVVDAEWLSKNLAEVTVLDVRSTPKTFGMNPEFEVDKKTGKKFLVELGGHIAGAVSVDNKKVRVERVVNGLKLAGMIPERADFEKLARGWGVHAAKPIVLVSAGMEPIDFNEAARLYWQFKVYGEDNIAVLNGGTAGWIADGREVVTTASAATEGNWASPADRSASFNASMAEVEKAVKEKTQLVDARDNATYLGLSKPGSVAAFGHLQGARNVPTTLMSTAGTDAARLHAADTYRDIFRMNGVDPQANTVAYCNTGHQASGTWFVLHEILGNKQARLYDGSMHEWTMVKMPLESVSRGK